MGWYIRKSKAVGPVRFNLSKSGIGVSTGVKGARVSLGPKGTYVNLGRKGIYYRKKISSHKSRNNIEKDKRDSGYQKDFAQEYADVIKVIPQVGSESPIGKMVVKDMRRAGILWSIMIILLMILVFNKLKFTVCLVFALSIIFPGYFNALVNYELEEDISDVWDSFLGELCILKKSKKLWIVESEMKNGNTKRNGGAVSSINKKLARVTVFKPNQRNHIFNIKTDVSTVCIHTAGCSLLFTPSDVYVKRKHTLAAYSYNQVKVSSSYVPFIEYGSISRDAEIIYKTWQYVNKDGSPDRRFKDNRQIPVCKYGVLTFRAYNSLNIEYHSSNNTVCMAAKHAILDYASYLSKIELLKDNKRENDKNVNEVNSYSNTGLLEDMFEFLDEGK